MQLGKLGLSRESRVEPLDFLDSLVILLEISKTVKDEKNLGYLYHVVFLKNVKIISPQCR